MNKQQCNKYLAEKIGLDITRFRKGHVYISNGKTSLSDREFNIFTSAEDREAACDKLLITVMSSGDEFHTFIEHEYDEFETSSDHLIQLTINNKGYYWHKERAWAIALAGGYVDE